MSNASGPFEILEVLGDGAFGAVFVARMTNDPLKRLVAIKVLKAEYASNPKVLHRTRDEARLLSQLHHPNIVRVEQLLEIENRPVLVMELVRGVSLKRLVDVHPDGLPASVAMEVIRQTCVALHVAYNHAVSNDGRPLRVIHRDIKPSNMLLSIHGQLKVVDFGIATGRFAGREAHTESVVMGSRPYMAPERLDGAADTPAVDIYSAGMSLLELLTGRVMNLSINPSHHDRTLERTLDAVSTNALPREHVDELRRLIRRMLAYDADYRPTAHDVAMELERLLSLVDPAYFVSLDKCASDAVEPLLAKRERVTIDDLADSELITGVFSPPPPVSISAPRFKLKRQTAMFFGAMVGMVAGLTFIAANKAMSISEANPGVDASMVRLKLWMPEGTRARVGPQNINLPGHIEAVPGPNVLELYFEDRTLTCPFEAAQGQALRYVGGDAISIDDGRAVNCTVTD